MSAVPEEVPTPAPAAVPAVLDETLAARVVARAGEARLAPPREGDGWVLALGLEIPPLQWEPRDYETTNLIDSILRTCEHAGGLTEKQIGERYLEALRDIQRARVNVVLWSMVLKGELLAHRPKRKGGRWQFAKPVAA